MVLVVVEDIVFIFLVFIDSLVSWCSWDFVMILMRDVWEMRLLGRVFGFNWFVLIMMLIFVWLRLIMVLVRFDYVVFMRKVCLRCLYLLSNFIIWFLELWGSGIVFFYIVWIGLVLLWNVVVKLMSLGCGGMCFVRYFDLIMCFGYGLVLIRMMFCG